MLVRSDAVLHVQLPLWYSSANRVEPAIMPDLDVVNPRHSPRQTRNSTTMKNEDIPTCDA
jgi:hypothetical protein